MAGQSNRVYVENQPPKQLDSLIYEISKSNQKGGAHFNRQQVSDRATLNSKCRPHSAIFISMLIEGMPYMPVDVFKKDLRINGRIMRFSFYGFNTVNGKRFSIAVHEVNADSVFNMMLSKDKVNWVIVDNAPSWIIEIEDELSDIITKQLKPDTA